MGTTASVVVSQSRTYVRREADVILWLGFVILENVDEPLVSGYDVT